MSIVYHGGQFEKTTGVGPRSQSWRVRKISQRPKALTGYTMFITNDRGHILDRNKKSQFHPHYPYAGTWDLPCKIPANIGSLTSYSEEKAQKLREDRINWTNDLKRVWLRLDPKYKNLLQHYRSTPGSKCSIKLPCEFEDLGLENHWDVPGIYDDRMVYPPQTVPESFLRRRTSERLKPPVSNKTHCFHWQGFCHPKTCSCRDFKDSWTRPFPSCLATIECDREYKYQL